MGLLLGGRPHGGNALPNAITNHYGEYISLVSVRNECGADFFLLAEDYHVVLASLPLIVACIADPFAVCVGVVPIALVGGYHILQADRRRGVQLLSVGLVSVLVSELAIALIPHLGGYSSASLPYFVCSTKRATT